MQIFPLIIISIMSFTFVILGIFLCNGKLLNLIAGYNSLTPSEKEKLNGKWLGRIVGIFLFFISFLMLASVTVLTFFPGHEIAIATVLLISLFIGIIILFIIKPPKNTQK